MTTYRKNSLVADMNVLPVAPDIDKIKAFLTKDVQLDFSAVRNLQWNISRSQVIIETATSQLAYMISQEHNMKHSIAHQNKKYFIPIFVEDGATEVKVHDLPPQMPNHLIASHLQQYGDVLSIRDEVWKDFFPGIPNGVRVVRMKIVAPIPSFLEIEKETAYIKHNHQIKTCRYCSSKLHTGQKCNTAKMKNTNTSNTPLDAEQQKNPTEKPLPQETIEHDKQTSKLGIDTSIEEENPHQITTPSKIESLMDTIDYENLFQPPKLKVSTSSFCVQKARRKLKKK